MYSVLIFAPNLNGGGAERVLVNYLNSLDYGRFKVTLVLAENKGVFLDLVPEEVQIIDLNKTKTVFCLFKLRKLISKLQPDIVYSTLIRTSIILSLSLVKIKNRPRVILRSPNSPKLLKDNGMLNSLQEKLLTYAYSQADLIIAQTVEMKSELVEYHRVDNNKIKVVHNPINKKLIESKLKGKTSPFDHDFINVVAAGRLIKQKGFDVLISSFTKVVQKNSLFRLHIIGEDVDNQLSVLNKRVECLNLSPFVTFHGFQENPYVFFKYADLYVLSSRWEGLPNTVLENLFLGKPVVATRCISFMEELIEDGVNGSLVDVENVDQLSIAILSYKKLAPKYIKKTTSDVDINSLFCMEKYDE